MNAHELRKHIAATPFLSGLSDRHVGVIAECACHTEFEAGEVIFRQGETANRFYLVERGAVQLEAALASGESSPARLNLVECWAGPGCSSRINGSSRRER